jgi:hypothetical protein
VPLSDYDGEDDEDDDDEDDDDDDGDEAAKVVWPGPKILTTPARLRGLNGSDEDEVNLFN